MKRYNRDLVAVLVLAAVLAVPIACGTSQPATAYRTIGSVKIAVDTGMRAWADRVIDGKATPAQEAKVRAAFDAYKAAAIAYIDKADGDSTAAPADIVAAANSLVTLLTAFGVKTAGGPL